MSIVIDPYVCIGCTKCTLVCPGTLIEMQKVDDMKIEKAVMQYPKDCWGCVSCVQECTVQAISFFLGADIGGNGSTMTTKEEGDVLKWIIEKRDGTVEEIDINRKDANKY